MLEELFYPVSHAYLRALILHLKDFEKIDDQYSRLAASYLVAGKYAIGLNSMRNSPGN